MPAGPLWDVIEQKLSGGALHAGSEVVLEVAEACVRDVTVRGSLLVGGAARCARARTVYRH